MSRTCDVAVVGSGFAGAFFAAIARRLGRSVVLLEKGAHPRFAIGESTSPLSNLLLESLGRRYDLPEIAALSKWGPWQARHPGVRGGKKRGFSFFHHRRGEDFAPEPSRGNELLVEASPDDAIADTHWLRADVDAFFVEQAAAAGVEYVDRIDLAPPRFESGGISLAGVREGKECRYEARFLVDASGPRGFLHRSLGLPEAEFAALPRTEGLFSHFRDVARLEDLGVCGAETPPYPIDDAALHHVFAGGWIWVLRFADGTTSAGAALSPELAREIRAQDGEPAWRRLLALYPTIERQFAGARPIRPFTHAPHLPFRTSRASGAGWLMLPSAAAFVDPLLSTGFPLALLGIERIAAAFEALWGMPGFEDRIGAIGAETLAEADRTARLVASLWDAMGDFETFAARTMVYFVAATFAEAARRLGSRETAGGFLGRGDAVLDRAMDVACESPPERLAERLRSALAERNVAGLLDPQRENWYRVDPAPLLDGADRLGATDGAVRTMLESCGFPGFSRERASAR